MKSLWCLLCCFLFIVQTIASKSHPITTLLNAKWNTTPICLEISEFLFDENPNLYWDYVNGLNKLPQPLYELDTDAKVYKSAVSAAEKLIGPIQLSLLKLVLSMHTMSPQVQAHFQVAREVLEQGDCKTNTFITIGSRVACNLDGLKKGLEKVQNSKDDQDDEDVYSFDHIYPGSENNTITVILYGEIGTRL